MFKGVSGYRVSAVRKNGIRNNSSEVSRIMQDRSQDPSVSGERPAMASYYTSYGDYRFGQKELWGYRGFKSAVTSFLILLYTLKRESSAYPCVVGYGVHFPFNLSFLVVDGHLSGVFKPFRLEYWQVSHQS